MNFKEKALSLFAEWWPKLKPFYEAAAFANGVRYIAVGLLLYAGIWVYGLTQPLSVTVSQAWNLGVVLANAVASAALGLVLLLSLVVIWLGDRVRVLEARLSD